MPVMFFFGLRIKVGRKNWCALAASAGPIDTSSPAGTPTWSLRLKQKTHLQGDMHWGIPLQELHHVFLSKWVCASVYVCECLKPIVVLLLCSVMSCCHYITHIWCYLMLRYVSVYIGMYTKDIIFWLPSSTPGTTSIELLRFYYRTRDFDVFLQTCLWIFVVRILWIRDWEKV